MAPTPRGLPRRHLLVAVFFALVATSIACADLDLKTLAQKAPRARVLIEVTFHGPMTAKHIPALRKLRLQPVTPNKDEVIGRGTSLFITQADAAAKLADSNDVAGVEWVKEYPVASHYFAYFEYAGEAPAPELAFTVAAPRSAPGRTLTELHPFVSPDAKLETASDDAGNRFVTATLTDVQPGQQVLFDFYAMYDYDTEAIVESSLGLLAETPMPESWPAEVAPFLQAGFHIESDAPEILEVAKGLASSDRLDERARAVVQHVGRSVKYDHEKREKYFGGRYTYQDSWEMWQGALGTLERGMGCCPDTAELKVALLRAVGIPARTAVHSGHLYAEIYVPERGWITDAPMYNIPLIRSPGPDNCAYFAWTPEAPVRCVQWGGRTQAFGTLRPGMIVDHAH